MVDLFLKIKRNVRSSSRPTRKGSSFALIICGSNSGITLIIKATHGCFSTLSLRSFVWVFGRGAGFITLLIQKGQTF